MRVLIEQIASRPQSPIISVSSDERVLLRLFRILSEEVQDEFLKEIGTKALISVCSEIGEDDDDVEQSVNDEVCSLMPPPPDYDSFNEAVEGYDMPSIIFGLARRDQSIEEDLAADAASCMDINHEFSPEDVEGFIARWREKVINEIEWRDSIMNLDSDSQALKRHERAETDAGAELLAQALAIVGGEIVVKPLSDKVKSQTIGRDTMSLVEMAMELRILMQKHPNQSGIVRMRFQIFDLAQDMKEDSDQSLSKRVGYQKQMLLLTGPLTGS